MTTSRPEYTEEDAVEIAMTNLRRTNPSPATLKIIEQIEAEIADERAKAKRSRGRRHHRAQRPHGAPA